MDKLSPAEESVMAATFKATMLRAADILDHITDQDVADAQLALHREGVGLEALAKVDRARLGAAHLRACAQMGKNARVSVEQIKSEVTRG